MSKLNLDWNHSGYVLLQKEEQSKLFDEELELFSAYMAGLSNQLASGHLLPMERAILKTYMIWKIKGEK